MTAAAANLVLLLLLRAQALQVFQFSRQLVDSVRLGQIQVVHDLAKLRLSVTRSSHVVLHFMGNARVSSPLIVMARPNGCGSGQFVQNLSEAVVHGACTA